ISQFFQSHLHSSNHSPQSILHPKTPIHPIHNLQHHHKQQQQVSSLSIQQQYLHHQKPPQQLLHHQYLEQNKIIETQHQSHY
ncbi:hypothetical protein O181_075494, partial [Austropuccinia psidii MF-1]|nr:hypothetical protein [Austropuccinia psidii MF-1]